MLDDFPEQQIYLIEQVAERLTIFIVSGDESQDAIEYEIKRNASINGAMLDMLAGVIDVETYFDIFEFWYKKDIDTYVDEVEQIPEILLTDQFGNVVGTA